MARTRQEIKLEITTSFMSNLNVAEAYGFAVGANFSDEFSLISIENIRFEIQAYQLFLQEKLFNQHKIEVDATIRNQKSGRASWYRTMALRFQYGFDLLLDQDYFDNSNATEAQIEASKIIKYAAVNESEDESRVIIKIAGETDNELAPITQEQRESFDYYLDEFRYAGVQTTVINYLPDLLYLNLQIQRDALVLDSNGMSILNGNYPVNEAIEAYMKLLPFDGEFVVFDFLTYIKNNAEGVIIPTVINIESAVIDPLIDDYGDPVSIPIKTIAESGYFKVANFDNITYVV
ncbi:nucleotidyltransferase [Winogradskyella undariae]|uniref:nucleotidyltransferase n=1 Tax=Winogradskyella undariae TaxID=1285465 RepID=UPI00156B502F|nr:nucleotidyltransferase [Winogradskyella undariae]NRR90667.1 nucleotidyltransferase [Winogradskyella undariae]